MTFFRQIVSQNLRHKNIGFSETELIHFVFNVGTVKSGKGLWNFKLMLIESIGVNFQIYMY